ncbi:MAG: DUF1549 and DUF1553 domain-containing protein [Verrucomicrobia bacterium]|nr:DUF1549 and DUF1553 domain-containing protein [Verrucomicrobiota bacterium]
MMNFIQVYFETVGVGRSPVIWDLPGSRVLWVCALLACAGVTRAEGAGGRESVPAATRQASGAGSPDAHWAFRPLERPSVPVGVGSGGETRNPIDSFIGARLERDGLSMSKEADRVTLIRRLYMVMLGLPPEPEVVREFVADPAVDAFERLVDRVLDKPAYGERWARHWLDVIRFAESNGFETNRERLSGWRFRDYVIGVFNADTPYDRFIREQLAGDTLGVDVGTGFLVGGPVDIVRSPDPVLTAQQRADELDDMVNTTGTAFLGLTIGCARCHSHKFDPISQSEYYSMSALFSGVSHGERSLPVSPEIHAARTEMDALVVELEHRLAPYQLRAGADRSTDAAVGGGLREPVNARQNDEVFEPLDAKFVRFTVLATSSGEPCIDELEVWTSERNVALASVGTEVSASGNLSGFSIHKLEHVNDGRYGNSHSWISNEAGGGWVELEFAKLERIERIRWGRDREGNYADRVATDYLIEVARKPGAWVSVASSKDREPFRGATRGATRPVYRFEGLPEGERTQAETWLVRLEEARARREALSKTPTVYAGTFATPGETHLLYRGDPMEPRESVAPATLALFEPRTLSRDAAEQERRVALADWIANPENPLTARVFVNRVWQHQFGTGLVSTPNDFGRNGAPPSHPELLNWLAHEFVRSGWSVKALQRLILTSATWRQSSAPRASALKVDAGCRLLWRFPPRRLEAEAIRDSILAVSGNIDRTAGGPSFYLHDVDRENVYHYQPKEAFGPEESRRMVYAFKVRMEQDGIFGAFDCPDGSLVMPRRSVSTTPLQALNLFNSPFIVGQAGRFAERLHRDAGDEVPDQVRCAWWLAFGRAPEAAELAGAEAFVGEQSLAAFCRAVLNANEFLFIP